MFLLNISLKLASNKEMSRQLIDKRIVELLQSNEPKKAFRLAVDEYTESIYWHLRRMVHIHEDADDLLQEVFTKVWLKLSSFQFKSTFYTWIYRIATNEALSFLRKKRNKVIHLSTSDEDLHLEQKLVADSLFNGDEAQLKLANALNTLPEKQKTVFHLRYFEEMSYDEISKVLNVSAGGLRSSYHLAVKKIEEYLKQAV